MCSELWSKPLEEALGRFEGHRITANEVPREVIEWLESKDYHAQAGACSLFYSSYLFEGSPYSFGETVKLTYSTVERVTEEAE